MNSVKSSKPPVSKSPALRYAKAVALAVVVAGVCIGAVKLTSKKVRDYTPEEIREKLESGELEVDRAIVQINRLDLGGRQELMRSEEWRTYVRKLPIQDRRKLVHGTIDKGIIMQLERYHKMNADEKAKFVEEVKDAQRQERERFLSLPRAEQDKRRAAMEAANIDEIIEKGVKAYLSVSTSEERAELAPLYEGALDNVRLIRGR